MDVSSGPKRTELISIQYLRGIAAMMVVVYHLVVNSGLFPKGAAFQASYPLNAGVDIFFVISGFIMWHTTRGRDVTPAGFMADRIIRIVPLYWTVTILMLALAYFAPGLMRSVTFNIPHGLASLFFIPVHHPVFQKEFWPVLVPGWSLQYEMFFYLIFAVSLAMPSKLRLGFLVGAITLIFVIGRQFDGNGLNVFFGQETNFEFIFGVLLSEAVARGFKLRRWICAVLIVAGFTFMACSEMFALARVYRWGIPALAIVGGAVLYEQSMAMPRIPALKLIGDCSYSLYLIHSLVIAACRPVFARILPEHSGWLGTAIGSIVIIAASVCAAYVAHRLIEKPASNYLNKLRRKNSLSPVAATSPAL